MTKTVTPALDKPSFTCPHCGAHANQTWIQLNKGGRDLGTRARIDASREPVISGAQRGTGHYQIEHFQNLNVSQCFSCKRMAVWVFDKIVWPATTLVVLPQEDMPADVRADFMEAAAIVDTSPRGAAALLRLAVERLMPHSEPVAEFCTGR